MASYKYAFKDYDKDTMARCALLAASVSTKHCIEICNHIRGRKVDDARKILNGTIEQKSAIPFKRFNHNVGHKKEIGPGRYPVKACTEILRALDSCEANAQGKGFNTSELKIKHICANMASRPWHYGRARRRKTKRTHIEIVVEEAVKIKKDKKAADFAEGKKEEKKDIKTDEKKGKLEKKAQKTDMVEGEKAVEKTEEAIKKPEKTPEQNEEKKEAGQAKVKEEKTAEKKTEMKSAEVEKKRVQKDIKKEDKPAQQADDDKASIKKDEKTIEDKKPDKKENIKESEDSKEQSNDDEPQDEGVK